MTHTFELSDFGVSVTTANGLCQTHTTNNVDNIFEGLMGLDICRYFIDANRLGQMHAAFGQNSMKLSKSRLHLKTTLDFTNTMNGVQTKLQIWSCFP